MTNAAFCLNTTPSQASIVLRASITDTVVVTGTAAGGAPTGVVTFTVCSFFFNDTATTEIYTLSLHDALPISSTATSAVFTPTAVGSYCFRGDYSGDTN